MSEGIVLPNNFVFFSIVLIDDPKIIVKLNLLSLYTKFGGFVMSAHLFMDFAITINIVELFR